MDFYKDVNEQTLSVVNTLNYAMNKLIVKEDDSSASLDEVDRAIDCADALAKILAVYHKGREVNIKHEQLQIGLQENEVDSE